MDVRGEGETYTVDVPGEQYWEDGRIRSGAGGYTAYYDAVDSCWVGAARVLLVCCLCVDVELW